MILLRLRLNSAVTLSLNLADRAVLGITTNRADSRQQDQQQLSKAD